MGIAERLRTPLHSTQEQSVQTLDSVFDTLHHYSDFDYLVFGNPGTGDFQFFIHPFGDGIFSPDDIVNLGDLLGQGLKANFPPIKVSFSPGINSDGAFMFPRFDINESTADLYLSGLIYPTQDYAHQVAETDVLNFELSRTHPAKIKAAKNEIDQRRTIFPKLKIPHIRLQEVLAGK